MTSTIAMNTEPGAELLAAAQSGVPTVFLEKLSAYRNGVRDPSTGAGFVAWISTPVNLTQVHTALVNSMGVPQRALAIRRLNVTRGQKVMMLPQAMEIAVKRTHNL